MLTLDLPDIQGDLLAGLQKNAELFLFFKITDPARFKSLASEHLIPAVTSAWRVQERERQIEERRRRGQAAGETWLGLNLGLSREGLTQLLGAARPPLDPAFERGAADPETIARLNDPPPSQWQHDFVSDRIDGVLLIAGPSRNFVARHGNRLQQDLADTIKVVHAEIGTVRPGRHKGHEHFGFLDGISQPGIRGLTIRTRPSTAPNQGLPGQDLVWPGEFVLGYPEQDPDNPVREGPVAPLPAPWVRNGSYMVFRRLEQRVPEFRRFVAAKARRLGMDEDLLAARMVGRWRSGAPLELAPLHDDPWRGKNPMWNNDFTYADDPFQRRCPYAAHIRKSNPRDDIDGNLAEVQRHRIIRAGIPFGPEVMPGETATAHSRGLMFVCYQASIERQFEFVQGRWSNNPHFVFGKVRPDDGSPVTPGFDPIVGQAAGGGERFMDEPVPNYPAGNRRSTLDMPEPFVVLTAAAYFFMPSLTALRTVLT